MTGAFIGLILFMLFKDHKDIQIQKSTNRLNDSSDWNEAESVFNSNFVQSLCNIEIKYTGVISTNEQKI